MGLPKIILLGTRGSALAVAQAEQVRSKVAALLPGHEVGLEVIKTSGDRFALQDPAGRGSDAEGVGIFTKELDEALLAGKIQAAIHSLKDVPTQLAPGIALAACLEREDPRDAWISKKGVLFRDIPAGSKVGTSSPRREAQVLAARPDLKVVPLRGNLDTRLKKLAAGDYDAIVVAAAGLRRLGREGEAVELLDASIMLPSPAQGILGMTTREGDGEMAALLGALEHPGSRASAEAERSFLRALEGGCRVPVGALAKVEGNQITLEGLAAYPGDPKVVRGRMIGALSDPPGLGKKLAGDLLSRGAAEILKRVRGK